MFWRDLILVFLGGGCGASSRFALNLGIGAMSKGTSLDRFPLGIFVCNVLGCFLIGYVLGLLGQRVHSPLFPFLVTGFLGGFTTFSTFGKDSHHLFSSGLHGHALLNIVASVALGILAVLAGLRLASS